jgi:adenosylcobinamide kinase/adenosylcobinamide-phosphate guanylyltransferase
MGEITFITGGARSGKSRFALKLAQDCRGRTAFIATCKPLDREMKKRIALHKNSRPRHWETFEQTRSLPALLNKIGSKFDTIIIDCSKG